MSNSPPEGGRRARREAERLAHQTASRDAEVLDSRRSRRSGTTPPATAHPRTDHQPARQTPPHPAPQTRRERMQHSGRLNVVPPADQPTPSLFDPNTGSFTALVTPADGYPVQPTATGSVPATRASRRAASSTTSDGSEASPGPETTELTVVRGRRAAAPQSSRRRFELAIGRSMSNRKVWGGVLVVALVAVVPGVSMLMQQDSVTVSDADLSGSGSDLSALQQFPDATRLSQPDTAPTTAEATARAKAKAKATADAAARTATAAARSKKKSVNLPPAGSVGRINSSRSGLPWASGLYMPGSKPSNAAAFGNWRGAAVDVVVDWPARQTWDDIVNPYWLYNAWKGTPYTKVFGVAPIPEGVDASLASCAAGSYNDKWRQFGEKIQASGLADETVIRLGWEFNGDWYKWSANDPGQFAECWRQIVGTVKQEAPKLLWDWNVNGGPGSSVKDARKAYPGDAYVDIVGIDCYDMFPGVVNEATWKTKYAGPYGLKFWADFAREHGKKVSVPEWGVYPGTAHAGSNGGDNPFYIAKMRGFFAEQGSRMAYEAYFNEDASYYAGSIFGPVQNPKAAAKYKALFTS